MINMFDEKNSFFYENGFYLTSSVVRMSNILSHYELYKKIIDLPGDVVELGVFKGGSFMQFSAFRELLENAYSRKIIGFDLFGEFPKAQNEADALFREKWVVETNNEYLTKEELQKALDFKGIKNTELVKGDIAQTVPEYVKNNAHMRIALLHIDVDIYEPAKIGLEYLYDRVVGGGVIILDDYGVAGETDAVEEFFRDKDVAIRKLNISQKKPSYIIKKEMSMRKN